MTTLAMKPIRYNRRQVALMIRIADYLCPEFAEQVGEPRSAIDFYAGLVADGCPLTPAILKFFGLQRQGKGYVWNPR